MSDRNVLVKDAMTTRVRTITPASTLRTALVLLEKHHISGLPVIDKRSRVVGVLSEKDIARALSEFSDAGEPAMIVEKFIHKAGPPKGRKAKKKGKGIGSSPLVKEVLDNVFVGEVMNQDPVVILPSASLDVAARIMKERNINRLPVVEGERLVGILTRHDVLSAWV